MGNVFNKNRGSHMRQSEIQFDFFSNNYNAIQYPKNLNFPFDCELYFITHKTTHQVYALKRMTFYSQSILQDFISMLENARTFRHENLLAIENYYIQENFTKQNLISHSVNIIMESFDHTLKEDLIIHQKQHTPFNEKQIYNLIIQMTDVLGFLHTNNLCHGNICPSNIFVSKDKKYKLCFVGEPLYKTESGINPNMMSLVDYLSPKLRANLNTALTTGKLPLKIYYDKYKSDIFSLGLITLQMASLKEINGLNLPGQEAERLAKVEECQKRIAPRLLSFMKSMLLENEIKRPNSIDIKGSIQIHDDEQSESQEVHRLRKQSFLQNFPKRETPKRNMKPKHYIEMKTMENYYDENDWENSHYEPSMLSQDVGEDLTQSMKGNFKEKMETLSSYQSDFIVSPYNSLSNPAAFTLKEDRMLVRRQTSEQKAPEENKMEKSNQSLGEDDFVINKEDDIVRSKNISANRLVIKLRGQSKQKNFAQLLAEFISKQTHLQELALNLSSMSLGEHGIHMIIKSIIGLQKLKMLFIEIRKDKITDEGIKAIGEVIKGKKHLVQLGIDLAGNSLTAKNCKELVKSLLNSESIKSLALNLGGNHIKNEGLIEICRKLHKLSSLESLVIFVYSNEIESTNSVETLIQSLNKLKKLKSLSIDLSDNLITDESTEVLMNFLIKSSNLKVSIGLLNNCMSETMREKMATEIQKNSLVQLRV